MSDLSVKRILIESAQVFRPQFNGKPLAVEYDFNKEPYTCDVTGDQYYLVTGRFVGHMIGEEDIRMIIEVKFRAYTDYDFSKMDTKEAIKKLSKKIEYRYMEPEFGGLRMFVENLRDNMWSMTNMPFTRLERKKKGGRDNGSSRMV